jgi:hypothetical protein
MLIFATPIPHGVVFSWDAGQLCLRLPAQIHFHVMLELQTKSSI